MPTPDPKAAFFDDLAGRWDDLVDPVATQETLDRILAPWSSDLAGRTVLDLGCGTGHLARYLADRPAPPRLLVALDRSLPMLRGCRGRLPALPLLQARAEALPLLAGSVDLIFAQGLLPHLDRPGEFLDHARNLLAPGGWLIFPHTASRNFINRIHREHGEPIAGDQLPPALAAQELLEKHGYRPGPSQDDDRAYLVSGRVA